MQGAWRVGLGLGLHAGRRAHPPLRPGSEGRRRRLACHTSALPHLSPTPTLIRRSHSARAGAAALHPGGPLAASVLCGAVREGWGEAWCMRAHGAASGDCLPLRKPPLPSRRPPLPLASSPRRLCYEQQKRLFCDAAYQLSLSQSNRSARGGKAVGRALAAFTGLRQSCCHPQVGRGEGRACLPPACSFRHPAGFLLLLPRRAALADVPCLPATLLRPV